MYTMQHSTDVLTDVLLSYSYRAYFKGAFVVVGSDILENETRT